MVAYLWMIAGYLVMERREKPKFIEPVIWHEPYTGGQEQLQPDI